MKSTSVGEFGVQLTHLGLVNCYLLRESDGWTVIDANLPKQGAAILAAATDRDLPIRRILLTHAHSDHVGSVDELAGLIPAVTLAIGRRESRLLRQPADVGLDPGEPSAPLRANSFPGIRTAPTHLIEPGELYGSLRCLPTPGHSPGHFSFLDERDGTLYAGDAIFTFRGRPRVAGTTTGLAAILNRFTWDKAMARQSVEALRESPGDIPIRRIASGHGRVAEGLGLIEQALARA